MKNSVAIIIFLLGTHNLLAQINVSIDRDCLDRNSAILSKVLMGSIGEGSFNELLEQDSKFMLIAELDSLGHISDILEIKSGASVADDLKGKIRAHLLVSANFFSICYETPLTAVGTDPLGQIKQELRTRRKNTFLMSIAFPGNLMSYYDYERGLAKNRGVHLSKYDYIVGQMKKLGIK